MRYVGKSETGGSVYHKAGPATDADYFRELPDPDDFKKWKGPGWYAVDSSGAIVSGPYKSQQEALEA